MKKLIALILSAVVGVAILSGCTPEPQTEQQVKRQEQSNVDKNTYGLEGVQTEDNQKRLDAKQPAPQIDFSVERANLQERVKRWNDPGKVSYIYLYTANGQLIAYVPVKGKVSSVNSMLTAPSQLVKVPYYNQYNVVESPDLDGSYGSNGDAIFFFDTQGTYWEWNGPYVLVDKPVQLNIKPIMVQNAN